MSTLNLSKSKINNKYSAKLEGDATLAEVIPSYQDKHSLYFDGTNDYISIADSNVLSFGDSVTDSAFSISCRVKLDGLSKQRFVTKSESGGSAIEYMLGTTAGNAFYVQLFDATSSASISFISSTAPSIGVWYHVLMTYDGSGLNTGLALYIDGSSISGTPGGSGYTAMHNTAATFNIGARLDTPQYTNGKISQVGVWNSKLTGAEVTAIYNSGQGLDLSSNSGNYVSSANLVGYWRLNEGSGTNTADSSGNGHKGTLTNGPLWKYDTPSLSPSPNYSVNFDGTNDYVQTTFRPTNGSDITASCWIKTTATSNGRIFANYNGGNSLFYFQMASNKLAADARDDAGILLRLWGTSGPDINDGEWHHVAVVVNGTQLETFIDGVSIETDSDVSFNRNMDSGDDFRIGTDPNVASYFDGSISNLCVWSSALTSSEILEIYNNGKPINLLKNVDNYVSSSNVVGYWRLDEGAGKYTKDISGNDLHGTLTNGPTWSSETP